MNSVMDDNKLLTLANGERIRLQSHCALLFEVMTVSDLQVNPGLARLMFNNQLNKSGFRATRKPRL